LNNLLKNKNFAITLNYIKQTEDIIQGLPKINELLENKINSNLCILSKRPGIYINNFFYIIFDRSFLYNKNNIIIYLNN